MKIPHLARPDRSRFYPLAQQAIRSANGRWPVYVNLEQQGGFPGSFKITLCEPQAAEFDSNFENTDWTLFPARIRAAATALRDEDLQGTFRISHHDGQLTIDL